MLFKIRRPKTNDNCSLPIKENKFDCHSIGHNLDNIFVESIAAKNELEIRESARTSSFKDDSDDSIVYFS